MDANCIPVISHAPNTSPGLKKHTLRGQGMCPRFYGIPNMYMYKNTPAGIIQGEHATFQH